MELQRWWERTTAGIVSMPTSLSRVQDMERRYAITLPEDFKAYLLNACPAQETCDPEITTWRQFERIGSIPEEYGRPISHPTIAACQNQCLLFADYSFGCWSWAISCADDENKGRIAMITGGGLDRFVASSFTDFVLRYLNDIMSLCP